MTRRAWLRHPARTIPAPPPCPNGPRYSSPTLALAALLHGLTHTSLEPVECDLGRGGWHNLPGDQT